MLGAIADDFTGATDLATMLRRSGHRVAVVNGAVDPSNLDPGELDAVVVALKSRTAPVDVAVAQTRDAVGLLRGLGASRFYVKYCSTFDSTPQGNIGPMLDAAREAVGATRSVVVPSLPANGRTVYLGHLFVGSELLEHSPMRHHPLTPMTASRVADLLAPQTPEPVTEVRLDRVRQGVPQLRSALEETPGTYVVVDAIDDDDLATIGLATADDVLVSGGSGLALGISGPGGSRASWSAPPAKRRVVLCGSVSARSLEQIAHAARSQPVFTIDVPAAARDTGAAVDQVVSWVRDQAEDSAPVVCAARRREEVVASAGAGFDPGQAVESVLSLAARRLVEEGTSGALVVAGGETSGAVVGALGASTLLIGPEIAPGVCWSLVEVSGETVALALKSGNFGNEDLFTAAWDALR